MAWVTKDSVEQYDHTPEPPKEYTKKEKAQNWWHYHKFIVLGVVVAILVGGSFFGVPGMFFGVPVFACFYSAANFFLDVRLRHKDLPLDTGSYTTDFPKTNIKAPPQEKNL